MCTRLAEPDISSDSPVSASHLPVRNLQLQTHTLWIKLFISSGDLNSSLHACPASVFYLLCVAFATLPNLENIGSGDETHRHPLCPISTWLMAQFLGTINVLWLVCPSQHSRLITLSAVAQLPLVPAVTPTSSLELPQDCPARDLTWPAFFSSSGSMLNTSFLSSPIC